jgi:creatinine amidohydrolase
MVDVCGGLHGAGAHRIVVVNWHEGNSPTLRLAADEAQRRFGVQVVIAESHVITHTLYPEEMEFTHAGSMETAAVLAYDAALVHLENAAGPSERQAAETAHGLFRRPDVYPVLRDFRQIAATGWYGRPERATPARAEQIAEAVADHVVARAREIWEALGTNAGGGAAEGSGPSGDRGFPPAGAAFPGAGGPE